MFRRIGELTRDVDRIPAALKARDDALADVEKMKVGGEGQGGPRRRRSKSSWGSSPHLPAPRMAGHG